MSLTGEQILLRVYLSAADRAPLTPTYERIVTAVRKQGLAGATVFKGILGVGSRGELRPSALHLTEHVPVVVEVVDTPGAITEFVTGTLARELVHGMATLERANVMMYRHRAGGGPNALSLGELIRPLSTVPSIPEVPTMTAARDGVLLRVFLGESDTYESRPLHEAIVQKVRERGLAGATVLRGVEGFGAHSVVHKAQLLEMSTDLPIVVEVVDTEANVSRLLPDLEGMVGEGMVTMEYVVILMYREGTAK